MNAVRFFRYIWRINAILLLLVFALTLCLLVWAAWELFGDLTRTETEQDVVTIADTEIDPAEFWLSNFEAVSGAPVVRADLNSRQDYGGKFSSSDTYATRNFLFYDYRDDQTRWLFQGNDQLIPWYMEVPPSYGRKEHQPVVAMLYAVVASDTDGDSRLTADDRSVLAITDPAGNDYAVLIENMDGHEGFELVDESTVLFFYRLAGTLRVAHIDVSTRRIAKDRELGATPGARPSDTGP